MSIRLQPLSVVLTLILLSSCAGHAAASKFQVTHSQIITDLLDGRLEQHDLLEAALVASGASRRAEFARHRWSVDRCVAVAKSQLSASSTNNEVAEAALRAIHQNILTGQFVDRCNNLATTLDRGDFNCVTATTVFQIVAKRLGLHSHVELFPHHVRCRLVTTSDRFTIETTSSTGVQVENNVITGRVITETQLLGKLYYNRALDLLAEQSFAAALRHAELAWKLDSQHREARENIALVSCHWAIHEAEKGSWQRACSLLRNQQLDFVARQSVLAAKHYVFATWIDELSSHVPAHRNTAAANGLREQLLIAIAQHPTDLSLLGMLQSVPQ